MKRLTNAQLASAAAYLNKTNQIAELIAHMLLQRNQADAKSFQEDRMYDEEPVSPEEQFVEFVQQDAYENFFSVGLEADVDDMIEVLASTYMK